MLPGQLAGTRAGSTPASAAESRSLRIWLTPDEAELQNSAAGSLSVTTLHAPLHLNAAVID